MNDFPTHPKTSYGVMPVTPEPHPLSSSPSRLTLRVRNFGHVPSFKNSKLLLAQQKRLITKPEYQRWMEAVIRSFESQLRSALAMNETGTMTALTRLLRIASSLPLDDSRKWITEHCVKTRLVSNGEEGADILIERIDLPKPTQLSLDESKPKA